jgi:hypothetical protein
VHVEEPFATAAHGVHEEPQLSTEVSARHCWPQRWKPLLQVKSHVAPVQVGVAFAGVVQAAHAPEHNRKPELHCRAQLVPLHEVAPLGSVGQGVHDVPQPSTELFARHCEPQRCVVFGQVKSQTAPLHMRVALAGVEQSAHVPLQRSASGTHCTPHAPLEQVAVALVSVGQALQA